MERERVARVVRAIVKQRPGTTTTEIRDAFLVLGVLSGGAIELAERELTARVLEKIRAMQVDQG